MMEKSGGILMQKFELGRLLGKGTFAKVYRARNINTGQSVAIKVINKEKALKVGVSDQIKREISVMSLVKHSNVVKLYEVMASKTKIYFVMEYVKGGELFNKVAKGRLNEDMARKYFKQLIDAVDFCHSRGVYHRDLKPENLLLDEEGNLKISDFGLSALWDSKRNDGLLHTACGTPAYAAPEVITNKGYDGAKADIWSCGVILYVLLAGRLPFNDPSLIEMYKKISKGEFKCPKWFPSDVRRLLVKIIDPNPNRRINISKVKENGWFRKVSGQVEDPMSSPDHPQLDWNDTSSSGEESNELDKMEPASFNAFDIIKLSQGFDLSGLFENDLSNKPRSRFITKEPTSLIVSKFEELAKMDKFKMMKKNGTLRLERNNEGGNDQLGIEAEIFEVAPSFYVVELEKTAGDTIDFKIFNEQDLRPSLRDIVWTWTT